MSILGPRRHLVEITDESWFPVIFRKMIQDCLTLIWAIKLPVIQKAAPADLVIDTLHQMLGDKISEYTYIDFCAGGGGPTPLIEREVNMRLGFNDENQGNENGLPVEFVLSDISPNVKAWHPATKRTSHLHYVPTSVNPAHVDPNLLETLPCGSHDRNGKKRKVFRMFFMSFHHFDDPLAIDIFRDTIKSSDGIGIFELVSRDMSSVALNFMFFPIMLFLTPIYFWGNWSQLFFSMVIPVVPFVLAFDGIVSSLRGRSPDELMNLVNQSGGSNGWKFEHGSEVHTAPLGRINWTVGLKSS